MKSLQEMIKISEGFSYSVNIEHDVHNVNKLKSYIPTDKTTDIIRNYCINLNGSYIIVGSYGTGKSHLMTLFANISSGNYKVEDYEPLIQKLKARDTETGELFKRRLQNKEKKLVILPDYQANDFNQAMLLGIRRALKRENLDDIVIDTHFKSVLETLDIWAAEYRHTYENFYKILAREYYIERQEFDEGIMNYDYSYYRIFTDVYPQVTSGARFVPYMSADICEVISEIYDKILGRGYSGIDIIFDEFGTFLETNIDAIAVINVQQLAELANNGDMNISLYVVVHKDFSQYSSKVSERAVSEWRKVQGRFRRYDIYQDPSDVYQLISRVILKDSQLWCNYYESNVELFDDLKEKTLALPTFYDLTEEDIYEYVIKGCWPITPLSAFSLYKLSELLAQSQRTLFTFLSTDDDGSFINFLNSESKNKWLTGDWIFDYFEVLMWGESKDSNVYKTWRRTKTALNKFDPNSEEIKKKIIKVLGIIYIINDFEKLRPNIQTIEQFLYGYEDINDHLDSLVEDNILFFRRSTGEFRFFEASDIDIEAAIDDVINNYDIADLKNTLNRDFLPMPLVPRRYNEENKINRSFVNTFSYVKDITYENVKKDSNNYNIDGLIYYLLPSSEEEIYSFLEKRNDFAALKNVIFIIPKKIIYLEDNINSYNAIKYLLSDLNFLEQDPLLKEELLLYLDDVIDLIEDKLSVMLNNDYSNIYVISEGKIKREIVNRYLLQQEASRLLDNYYAKSIIVNNEMLNRNKITRTMKRIVGDVIDEIWNGNRDEHLGFKQFNAQHTTLRTVLINTNILSIKNGKLHSNIKNLPRDESLYGVFDEVYTFLDKCRQTEKSFNDLFSTLKRKPYGIKNGIIPLLLAVPLYEYLDSLYVRRDENYQDIEGKLLVDMINAPTKYFISIDVWEEERENYIKGLEKVFIDYIDLNHRKKNRLTALYNGIKKYYIMLPRFARTTNQISENAKKFRDIIEKDFIDHKSFFFDILKHGVDFDKALRDIKNAKYELDDFIGSCYGMLSYDIAFIFDENNNVSLQQAIENWKSGLSSAVFNNVFDMRTNIFLKYIQNPEEDFLRGLVKALTGFELEFLTDELVKQMLEDLKKIKKETENFGKGNKVSNESIVIEITTGQKVVCRNFKRTELSPLAHILKNKVVSDINSFGLSISEEEKLMLLVEIINENLY